MHDTVCGAAHPTAKSTRRRTVVWPCTSVASLTHGTVSSVCAGVAPVSMVIRALHVVGPSTLKTTWWVSFCAAR